MVNREAEQQITHIQSARDALEPSFGKIPENICLKLVEEQIRQTPNLPPEVKSRLLQRIKLLRQTGQEGY